LLPLTSLSLLYANKSMICVRVTFCGIGSNPNVHCE
jgi:hypothetical protein